MAEKPDTFIREVDEELRREQLRQLWDQYGLFIAGGAVALLAGVWGFTHWQGSRASAAAMHGVQFEEAARLARDGKPDDAIKAFTTLSKAAAPGYQGLAEMRLAALQAKAGKVTEAVAAYDVIARDTSIDIIVRDLAGLRAANLRLPDADLAEMERRLATLTLEGAPWRAAAKEIQGLALYKVQVRRRPQDLRAVAGRPRRAARLERAGPVDAGRADRRGRRQDGPRTGGGSERRHATGENQG